MNGWTYDNVMKTIIVELPKIHHNLNFYQNWPNNVGVTVRKTVFLAIFFLNDHSAITAIWILMKFLFYKLEENRELTKKKLSKSVQRFLRY